MEELLDDLLFLNCKTSQKEKKMKKIIFTTFAAISLLLSSNQAFALFSVSVGVPLNASYSSDLEHDSISGYFIGFELPFLIGLGMDNYKAKVKDSIYELNTSAYNVFYKLPIPVINIILGVGTGSETYKCNDVFDGSASSALSCDDYWEKGSLTQWYTSIGMPIIPFFDIHLSYRSITSKNVKVKSNAGGAFGDKAINSRSVTGVGRAFNF